MLRALSHSLQMALCCPPQLHPPSAPQEDFFAGKSIRDDGLDAGGKGGGSLAGGGWPLTMGSEIFSRTLYNCMLVLLPCLFNIAAVVVHL